jgi:hypothetical protein
VSYISSNNNRWYCQLESLYGQVPVTSPQGRFPAVQMSVQQKVDTPARKDKTGTRTFAGATANMRKNTTFALTTYMTAWTSALGAPGYGPLFQSALGAVPLVFSGGTASATSTATVIGFAAPHGLAVGQAITFSGEIRFVVSVIDAQTVLLSAPFSTIPGAGAAIGPTVTYLPATELPSFSLFDYWTPSAAVQRLLCGCAVDQMQLQVNGDYQEFAFSGMAQDVLDSSSFVSGEGQLTAFPNEPALGAAPTTVIPGHLGEAWLGTTATQFYTLTGAKVTLKNQLDMRTQEFGSILPMAINPGTRSVQLDMELYGQDDAATVSLYQAARQRTPITAGFQIGQAAGQLLGVYMKSVVPEVPQYDDKESRLQWQFSGSRAQGQGDDEIVIAFG